MHLWTNADNRCWMQVMNTTLRYIWVPFSHLRSRSEKDNADRTEASLIPSDVKADQMSSIRLGYNADWDDLANQPVARKERFSKEPFAAKPSPAWRRRKHHRTADKRRAGGLQGKRAHPDLVERCMKKAAMPRTRPNDSGNLKETRRRRNRAPTDQASQSFQIWHCVRLAIVDVRVNANTSWDFTTVETFYWRSLRAARVDANDTYKEEDANARLNEHV